MLTRTHLLLGAALVLIVPTAAAAMLADVPLEIITARSELIVVGKVVGISIPVELTLKTPDSPRPIKAYFRKYRLKISQVITENGLPAAKTDASPKDRAIDIFVRVPRPQRAGGPRVFVSDQYFASLAPGESYVLILRKMPDKPEYYLPSYPKNYGLAKPEQVARIRRAALVDKWSWGPAVGGLQIALMPQQTSVQLRQIRRLVRDKSGRMKPQFQGQSAQVRLVVALRNTSKKPISVSFYPGDRFLSITAKGPGGKTVKPDLYASLARMRLAPFGPKNVTTIEPGKLLFISPMGAADYGMSVNLDVAAGKWKLTASYTASRKGIGGKQKLWTGKTSSTPVRIEVRPARRVIPARRPRGSTVK